MGVSDLYEGMYDDPYAVRRIRQSVQLVLPFLNGYVVDIGCYQGELKKYLPSHVSYLGVDYKILPDVQEFLACNLDNSSDLDTLSRVCRVKNPSVVFCLEILEHIKEPYQILQLLQKSLTENARIVISLPNEATLFHRIRAFMGTLDAEAFREGKHLSLPNIAQSRALAGSLFKIEKEIYYISKGAKTRNHGVARFLTFLPDSLLQFLADYFPSLFARGTIFLLRKESPHVLPRVQKTPSFLDFLLFSPAFFMTRLALMRALASDNAPAF